MNQALNHGGGNFNEESITLNAADHSLLLVIEHWFSTSCLRHRNHISRELCLLATARIETLKLAFLEEFLQALLERTAEKRPSQC